MFYTDEALKRYYLGTPFEYGGNRYTVAGATHATFISLGFKQVLPGARPDSRFYVVAGPNAQGNYDKTPRDLGATQSRFCNEQAVAANQNLMSTDYVYARAAEQTRSAASEDPVAVPTALVTQREEVRTVCKTNCALIMTTKDIEELEALVKAPALVREDPTDPNTGMIPNPDPHLNPLPVFDEQEYMLQEFMPAQAEKGKKAKR